MVHFISKCFIPEMKVEMIFSLYTHAQNSKGEEECWCIMFLMWMRVLHNKFHFTELLLGGLSFIAIVFNRFTGFVRGRS